MSPRTIYFIVMCQYTETTEPIFDFWKTDTDTDSGIRNAENTEYRQLNIEM